MRKHIWLIITIVFAVVAFMAGMLGAKADTGSAATLPTQSAHSVTSPNTVDVWLGGHMSMTAKYPTAIFTYKVRNNTGNAFRTVGHMVAVEDGVALQPTVLTFPFPFDGAKPDLHWHMPLGPKMPQTLKFKVRVTARQRYCLKINLVVTYVNAPKGGAAYVKACVNVPFA